MNTQFSEEQKILRDSVAKFVQALIPVEKVREMADDPKGVSGDLWEKIAEQGWLGLLVPEDDGGIGMTVTDLGIVCEELGRHVVPGPFRSTVLAGYAIAMGDDALKSKYLERIVAGECKGVVALLEEEAQLGPEHVAAKAVATGGGYAVSGKKYFVEDAVAADVFIVAAHTDDGLSLFAVDANADGVTVAANKLYDLTSRSGQVTLDNAPAAIIGGSGQGWPIIDRVLQVANVCIAAESIAGAEHILKLTVGYAKERTQFGQLIGSFQAVKHPLADLFSQIESAKSAYYYAAWAVDAQSDDVNAAVATARLTANEAYRKTTLDCLQAHGGIAFTWEYDLHLYLKRAKHNQHLYGMAHDYEAVVAREALGI